MATPRKSTRAAETEPEQDPATDPEAATQPAEPTPTTSPSNSADYGTDALGKALAAMRDAAGAEEAQRAAEGVIDALGGLTDEQLKMALGQQAIQELIARAGEAGGDGLKPGSEMRDRNGRLIGKRPWTARQLMEHYGGEEAMVEWVPPKSGPVSINGIMIYVQAGVPVTTPPAFRDIMTESYQADLNQRQTSEKIMRQHFGGFGEVWDNA